MYVYMVDYYKNNNVKLTNFAFSQIALCAYDSFVQSTKS